ncbi:MAG: hypothetical protein ACO1QR_11760 [Chthoniobacteraceae bacterium]
MSPEDVRWNRKLVGLVLLSVTVLAIAVVLRVGIGNTSYETVDSVGRSMGFNDPLSAEHYWIMVQNFDVADLFRTERIYDWILLGMHGLGAWLLLSARYSASRLTRWFFAFQPVLFPLGLLFSLFSYAMIFSALIGDLGDRETFIDLPFVIAVAQPVWVVSSMIIFFAMRAPGLGMAQVWSALKAGARAGGQTFVTAVK